MHNWVDPFFTFRKSIFWTISFRPAFTRGLIEHDSIVRTSSCVIFFFLIGRFCFFFLPLHLHQDSACMMICNGKCNAISRLSFSSSSWLKPKPKKRLLNWIKYMEKEALSVLWINQWSICCWTMIRRCRQAAMECDGTATRRTRSNDSHGSGGDIMTMFTLWKIAVLYFFLFSFFCATRREGAGHRNWRWEHHHLKMGYRGEKEFKMWQRAASLVQVQRHELRSSNGDISVHIIKISSLCL